MANSGASRGPLVALLLAVLLALSYRYIDQLPQPLQTALGMSLSTPLLMSRVFTRLLPITTASVPARVVPAAARNALASASATTFSRRPASNPLTGNSFSTTAAMSSKLDFEAATANRRTIYALQKKSPISDDRIKEIVNSAIKNVPSSFNAQSTRLVVLLKDEHDKFWDIVKDILKNIVPAENWDATAGRIGGFRGGYGTVLFYEDPEPVKKLQSAFAIYADRMPVWSEHTSAMHQYNLWTAFEAEGFGANLQHYNPLPDQKVSETWGVPLDWSLKAQLVFGLPAEGARDNLKVKEQKPIEDRVFVHGA